MHPADDYPVPQCPPINIRGVYVPSLNATVQDQPCGGGIVVYRGNGNKEHQENKQDIRIPIEKIEILKQYLKLREELQKKGEELSKIW